MCIAVPCKIVSIQDDIATIEVSGVRREASLSLVTDAVVGDYVIVHAGYAIQKIDKSIARESLTALNHVFSLQNDGDDPSEH